MGSEQSAQLHQQQVADCNVSDSSNLRSGNLHRNSGNASSMRSTSSTAMTCSKLQRGNTIAVSGSGFSSGNDPSTDKNSLPLAVVPSSPYICDSRPVSPPMSVCSDSELPYISYTDKPIGGKTRQRRQQSIGKIMQKTLIFQITMFSRFTKTTKQATGKSKFSSQQYARYESLRSIATRTQC